jgi:signal transduction histidine kinase
VLDRLLEAEPVLRRNRHRLRAVLAAMFLLIALADARLWPRVSFALGYAVPISLGAYVFGVRVGIALSLLGVVLRTLCAGRSYEEWWLFAGSALMLTEYLALAVGVGLLGRAVRRLERYTHALEHLGEVTRQLTATLEREALLRHAVKASVELAGADGGFVTDEASGGGAPVGSSEPPHAASRARATLSVPIPHQGPGPPLKLAVFRTTGQAFSPLAGEVLGLFALHVAAALTAADLYAAAREATREKGRMLAHVAHELGAPLHVILGTTELLARHADDLGRAYLERLERQTRLLIEMTSNLLEFSRLEATQPVVRREVVYLPELWARVRELAFSFLSDKDVEVAVWVEPGAEWVESDPEKLRQILTNLATNAVKYTPRGRVELSATRADGGVVLAVRDTGIGIPPTERDRIFEPFYRSRHDGVPRAVGVGLGLALAQDHARLLGTRILVESHEHEGSTFSLVLPSIASGDRRAEASR